MANINIYGTLYNNTTDPKIAYAEQVYDQTQSQYQSDINKTLLDKSVSFTQGLDSGSVVGTLEIDGQEYTLYYKDTTYNTATSTTQGIVALGSDTVQTVAANEVTSTASRTYAVQLNSSGQLVVNVPWSNTNTTYSTATSDILGIVKLGSDTVQTVAANSVTSTASRTYAVQMNSDSQLVVNVPWTDTNTNTTYEAATSTDLGLVKLGSDTVQTVAAATPTTTASRTYAVQMNSDNQLVVNVPWTDTNTTYTSATSDTLGLVKLGSDTVQSVAANSVTSTSDRTYAVQVDSDGKMMVNVPWSNTTYSAATTTASGLMSSDDKEKLDEILLSSGGLQVLRVRTSANIEEFLYKGSGYTFTCSSFTTGLDLNKPAFAVLTFSGSDNAQGSPTVQFPLNIYVENNDSDGKTYGEGFGFYNGFVFYIQLKPGDQCILKCLGTSSDVYNTFLYDGYNEVSTLTSIPIDKKLVIATISENATLTLSDTLSEGKELHVIINNSSSSNIITITLPDESTLDIDSSSYGEVNIIYINGTYYIKSA